MTSFFASLGVSHESASDSVASNTVTAPIISQQFHKGVSVNQQGWMQYLIRALAAVPLIVAGIEHVHGDAMAGADKKTLALESLGLANYVAPAIDPQHQAVITAAAAVAGNTIDGVVAVMNAAKQKQLTATAPAPAPAP